MDVCLIPKRDGGYVLHAAELDAPSTSRERDPESEPARSVWTVARRGYDRLTRRRRQKELLLSSLGSLERVRILYPSSMTKASARRIYAELIQQQTSRHKKWMAANAAAIPVAVPLSLIPGPNVLLFYLAWRSVSHYKSKKAGEKAAELPMELVADDRLAELGDLVGRWPFRARRGIRKLGENLGFARLDRLY